MKLLRALGRAHGTTRRWMTSERRARGVTCVAERSAHSATSSCSGDNLYDVRHQARMLQQEKSRVVTHEELLPLAADRDVEINLTTLTDVLSQYDVPMDPEEVAQELERLTDEEKIMLEMLKLQVDERESLGYVIPQMDDRRWLGMVKNCNCNENYEVLTWLRRFQVADGIKIRKKYQQLKKGEIWNNPEYKSERLSGRLTSLACPVIPVGHYEKKTTQQLYRTTRLSSAWLHGPRLVLDCAWEHIMGDRKLRDLADQFLISYTANMVHHDPFHLVLTGLQEDGRLRMLQRYNYQRYGDVDRMLLESTEKCYADLFPPERLVYLTPQSRYTLKEFNENDIYVIGMIVDDGAIKPHTYAKAKEQGIRTMRFPIDNYLNWKSGSKALTIPACVTIMNVLKNTGDMKGALLAGVPERHLGFGRFDHRRYNKLLSGERFVRQHAQYHTSTQQRGLHTQQRGLHTQQRGLHTQQRGLHTSPVQRDLQPQRPGLPKGFTSTANHVLWTPLSRYKVPEDPELVRLALRSLSEEEQDALAMLKLQFEEADATGVQLPDMTDQRWLHLIKNIDLGDQREY